jgi:hypothetical protein
MTFREAFYECIYSSSATGQVPQVVRAWTPAEAERVFRGQLDFAGLPGPGTITVRDRTGQVVRSSGYRPRAGVEAAAAS